VVWPPADERGVGDPTTALSFAKFLLDPAPCPPPRFVSTPSLHGEKWFWEISNNGGKKGDLVQNLKKISIRKENVCAVHKNMSKMTYDR